jgi:hypothetical protein
MLRSTSADAQTAEVHRVPRNSTLGLTGVAADGGAMERAEALAAVASTARDCMIRRS